MKKAYKVITMNGFGEVYIECFDDLDTAIKVYGRSISYGCSRCYLLETETEYETSGGSCNKILFHFSHVH